MGLLVRVALAVAANAVALLLAAILLDGVEIGAASFVAALAVFSLASLVVRPLVAWGVVRYASALGGVVVLLATFVVLLVTDVLSDGLDIEGALDWVLATAIVWLATAAYSMVSVGLQRRVVGKLRPREGAS
jgi:putative membrane protein